MTAGAAPGSSAYLNRIKKETNRIERRRAGSQPPSTSLGDFQCKENDDTIRPSEAAVPVLVPAAANLGSVTTSSAKRETAAATRLGESYEFTVQEANLAGYHNSNRESEFEEYMVERKPKEQLKEEADPDCRGESFSGRIYRSFEDPVPIRNMSSHLLSDHEAFRQRLIAEVLGNAAGDKVPMEKVVMIIWQYRDDPTVVRFMTRFVAKVRKQWRAFCLRWVGTSDDSHG